LGALAYPALLIVMSMSIFNGLLLFVLPRFNDMFVQLGVETPGPTRILLATGAWLRTYWYAWGSGLVLLGGAVVWLIVNPRGRQWLTDLQLVIPLLGRLRSRLIQAQVLRTMGTLLEAKVGVLDSLALVRKSTRTTRFQRLFTAMEDAVTSGGNLSAAFEGCKMIEPAICQAVRTGEDAGNLGGAMTYCADVLDESNSELVKVVSRLLEPVILIVMGFVVGFVAVSLFLPLFDLTSAMG
jgi:type II secretory pathway component PulF